jgi:hypothetical protein
MHNTTENNEYIYDSSPPPLSYDCTDDEFVNAIFYEDLETNSKTFTKEDISEDKYLKDDVDILPTKKQLYNEFKITQLKYLSTCVKYNIDESILDLSISKLNNYIKTHKISKNEAINIKKTRRKRLNAFYARANRAGKNKKHK